MSKTVRRAQSAEGKHWSDSQKVDAVKTFVVFGNVPAVESALGVPRKTVHYWKTQQWWKDLESEIRAGDDIELSAKLKKVIDKSVEVLGDRLDKGDFVYDQKSGELKRRPVSMRDAHVVAKDLIDKKRVLDNKPTQITETRIEDRLAMLAQKFEDFALSFKRDEKVIDGTLIYEEIEADPNAVHD
jgi:hypothetical protein